MIIVGVKDYLNLKSGFNHSHKKLSLQNVFIMPNQLPRCKYMRYELTITFFVRDTPRVIKPTGGI